MSGPAVVIGFILLIPSVIGMVICALFFFGFLSHVGVPVQREVERGRSPLVSIPPLGAWIFKA